jgi:hypothetical protein
MDFRKIDNIIDRFYNGQSSLAEERILKEYILQNENLSREFEVLRNYFRFTEIESEIEFPKQESIFKSRDIRSQVLSNILIYGAAACLVVALFSVRFKQDSPKAIDRLNEITYYQKKQIYNQAKEALMLISVNLNKGNDGIKRLAIFDQVQKQIIKN